MTTDEAINLLRVSKYVSKNDLKKKYIHLIKLHHPDVNSDKLRANKLTADIIEAYNTVTSFRDREMWIDSSAEEVADPLSSSAKEKSKSDINHNTSPINWESLVNGLPLDKNPFWDYSLVFNYDIVPESFLFLDINTRFPDRISLDQAYKRVINRYSPENNPNDADAREKCLNISFAYCAAIALRTHENWVAVSSIEAENDSIPDQDFDLSDSDETSSRYYREPLPQTQRQSRPTYDSNRISKADDISGGKSDGSVWGWVQVFGFIGLLIYGVIILGNWLHSEKITSDSGQKKRISDMIVKNELKKNPEQTIKALDIDFYEKNQPEIIGNNRKGYLLVKFDKSVVRVEFVSRVSVVSEEYKKINYEINLEYSVSGVSSLSNSDSD